MLAYWSAVTQHFRGFEAGSTVYAAIRKRFRSHDAAAVVRCEKQHGLRALVGCAHAADGV